MAHYVSTAANEAPDPDVPRSYAWIVFGLSLGLLISDYMSRQVLNAVFPLLKSEWALSDARLGLLSGVVALMVGLLTFPLSLLADRWGRVRSLVLMAVLWSLATLACALARDYPQMLAARLCVGIGEAAYGSVGIAVVLSVFPARLRATVTSAFMAGGMFGSVLGMASGGVIAAHFGWRWAFAGMALFGLVLAAVYALVVRESRIRPSRDAAVAAAGPAPDASAARHPLRTLYSTRSVLCAYVGSGLQLFISGSVLAWIPSFLNRYYQMGADRAGVASALFVLLGGAGMILCGMLSDRLCRGSPARKLNLAISYSLLSGVLLSLAFWLPAGTPQLALLALGMLVAAGTTGPAGAMVANLTHPAIHGTAFATLTLANNLLGLAPGPWVTGLLADAYGLQHAFQLVALISLGATAAFLVGQQTYLIDLQRAHATHLADAAEAAA